jgi:hypothetical protein
VTIAHFQHAEADLDLLVSQLQSILAKKNYTNFTNLNKAFLYYDKDRNGCLSKAQLKRICFEYHLPVDDGLLDVSCHSSAWVSCVPFCVARPLTPGHHLSTPHQLIWWHRLPCLLKVPASDHHLCSATYVPFAGSRSLVESSSFTSQAAEGLSTTLRSAVTVRASGGPTAAESTVDVRLAAAAFA